MNVFKGLIKGSQPPADATEDSDAPIVQEQVDPITIGKVKRRNKPVLLILTLAISAGAAALFFMDDKPLQGKKEVNRGEVETAPVPSVLQAARSAATKPDAEANALSPTVSISATGVKVTEPKPVLDDKIGTAGFSGGTKDASKSAAIDETAQLEKELAEQAAEELRNQLYSQKGEVTGLRLATPPVLKDGPGSSSNGPMSALDRRLQAQLEKTEAEGQASINKAEELQRQVLDSLRTGGATAGGTSANGLTLSPQPSSNSNTELASRLSQDAPTRVSRVIPPVAKIVSDEGTVIEAGLVTALNSQLPGKVLAQVTRDIYDSRTGLCKVVPAFSKLIGEYNSEISIGQERIFVAFSRLILPDGRTVNLAGSAASSTDGSAGMEAKINLHFWKQFGAAFAISAVSLALPKDRSNVAVNVGPAGQQSVGSVAAITMSEVVRNILERNRRIAPSATRDNAFQFNVLVARDIAWEDKCY